jgi:hypothetical protein
MNRFIDFDPYTIREHNRQTHTEVNSLRLQERLRKNREDCKGVADGLLPRRELEAGAASCNRASRA